MAKFKGILGKLGIGYSMFLEGLAPFRIFKSDRK